MATQPQEEKKKKARNEMGERGPNPAHILLDAISAALKAGADRRQIILLVDMARQAYGTDQSTSWKMVAGSLRETTAEAEKEQQAKHERIASHLTSTMPDTDAG